MSIHFANFLASSLNEGCSEFAHHVQKNQGISVQFLGSKSIDHGLFSGIQLGFLCSLPYIAIEEVEKNVSVLCAPLFNDPRIDDTAFYFSDIVIRRDIERVPNSIDDLKGLHLICNHRISLSGYLALKGALSDKNLDFSHFTSLRFSGSHEESLESLRCGDADVAAIDSHVWNLCDRKQGLKKAFSLGPYPAPPIVIARSVPEDIRLSLLKEFLELHTHEHGKRILDLLGMKRFIEVNDSNYLPVRTLYHQLGDGYDAFKYVP